MECAPVALLATAPPTVATLALEGSGPNMRPRGARVLFRPSIEIPGSTLTLFPAVSTSITSFMYFERSRIIPSPTACPARLVPAPRTVTGISRAEASETVIRTSWRSLGITIACGRIL